MAAVEKLSIALTPEMAQEIRKVVNTGEYASSSEVIREALRDWRRKRALQDQELDDARALWQAGIESGGGQHGSMADIKRAARERLDKIDKA